MTQKKTTSKSWVLLGLAFFLLSPWTLMAQPPDDPGNGNGGNNGNGRGLLAKILPPPGYLQLTDEQKESVQALATDSRDDFEALREERQNLGQQLRDALNADDPDPTTVGQLTLDLRQLGSQARDQVAAFEAAFRDLLDADQQTKWDNYKELRGLQSRQGGGKKARRVASQSNLQGRS